MPHHATGRKLLNEIQRNPGEDYRDPAVDSARALNKTIKDPKQHVGEGFRSLTRRDIHRDERGELPSKFQKRIKEILDAHQSDTRLKLGFDGGRNGHGLIGQRTSGIEGQGNDPDIYYKISPETASDMTLSGANFLSAEWKYVHVEDVPMRNFGGRRMTFDHVNFTGDCDGHGAFLTEAIIRSSNLSGLRNLRDGSLRGAIIDERSTLRNMDLVGTDLRGLKFEVIDKNGERTVLTTAKLYQDWKNGTRAEKRRVLRMLKKIFRGVQYSEDPRYIDEPLRLLLREISRANPDYKMVNSLKTTEDLKYELKNSSLTDDATEFEQDHRTTLFKWEHPKSGEVREIRFTFGAASGIAKDQIKIAFNDFDMNSKFFNRPPFNQPEWATVVDEDNFVSLNMHLEPQQAFRAFSLLVKEARRQLAIPDIDTKTRVVDDTDPDLEDTIREVTGSPDEGDTEIATDTVQQPNETNAEASNSPTPEPEVELGAEEESGFTEEDKVFLDYDPKQYLKALEDAYPKKADDISYGEALIKWLETYNPRVRQTLDVANDKDDKDVLLYTLAANHLAQKFHNGEGDQAMNDFKGFFECASGERDNVHTLTGTLYTAASMLAINNPKVQKSLQDERYALLPSRSSQEKELAMKKIMSLLVKG